MKLKIGTRGSKLALVQTEHVIDLLMEKYPENEYEKVIVKTKGDLVKDKPLSAIGSFGVFVKEIEEMLLNKEIDIAVHSMKDMPADTAHGLVLSKFLKREDNRDVLIINEKKNPQVTSFMELKGGAIIGTGSIRRSTMLKKLRSDIDIVNIRGNVDTRLKKMYEQEMDGIVLAAAGLKRLRMENIITEYFDTDKLIPAPGQGILALECREEDLDIKIMLDSLYDKKTYDEGSVEREFLKNMAADCHTPIGASCTYDEKNENYVLNVFYGRADGSKDVMVKAVGKDTKEILEDATNTIRKKMAGKVWLVGAGPGDVGLMTIKGMEIIKKADCIIYDRLANEEFLNWCKKDCEKIYVGKQNHHHTMKQEDINKLLIKKAMEHNVVVRLKGGDPYVFGRGGEECLCLYEAGIDFFVVPGVTSAIAGLCYAGIPITHRGLATGMRIVTAHNKRDELADIDFKSMANGNETLVFMMGFSKLSEICKNLLDAGMEKNIPIAVISNATTDKQRVVVGNLTNIEQKVSSDEKMTSPALIVVGKVVELNEKLAIKKEKYIIPRIEGNDNSLKKNLSDCMRDEGFLVTEVTTGKIDTLDVSLEKELFEKNELIIFTSTNGVHGFFENLYKNGLDARAISNCKVMAIGEKTMAMLMNYGIIADSIPTEYDSEKILELVKTTYNENAGIIYVNSLGVKNSITEKLSKNYKLTCLPVYENKAVHVSEEERNKLIYDIKEAAGIMFTCASNVERFMDILGDDYSDLLNGKKIISIGNKCSSALIKYGITEISQADKASYEAMVLKVKANT